jgi:serine/threonine-protein kinase
MMMSSGVVKLMDFGIARSAFPGASGPVGSGSPHYMSPEQARRGDLDPRSDLYSAGVTLFEVFTGKRPFESDTQKDLLRQHQHQAPPPLREVRADMPEGLEKVILSCLAKDRTRRPASASDLERAFMRVQAA